MAHKIQRHFGGSLEGRTIAVWGLAFKPNTDDLREAPSLAIIRSLLSAGAVVHAHDPVANEGTQAIFGDTIRLFDNNYDALRGADALVVVTEWNEFRRPNFERMKTLMKNPVIFDGRNIYSPPMMEEAGFVYYGIGRGRQ
jgi:UDPglucose 6-dehydrogenase